MNVEREREWKRETDCSHLITADLGATGGFVVERSNRKRNDCGHSDYTKNCVNKKKSTSMVALDDILWPNVRYISHSSRQKPKQVVLEIFQSIANIPSIKLKGDFSNHAFSSFFSFSRKRKKTFFFRSDTFLSPSQDQSLLSLSKHINMVMTNFSLIFFSLSLHPLLAV